MRQQIQDELPNPLQHQNCKVSQCLEWPLEESDLLPLSREHLPVPIRVLIGARIGIGLASLSDAIHCSFELPFTRTLAFNILAHILALFLRLSCPRHHPLIFFHRCSNMANVNSSTPFYECSIIYHRSANLTIPVFPLFLLSVGDHAPGH